MDFSKTVLGIELGSTRIKGVLLDEKFVPIVSGSFDWENQLVDGVWTYSLDMIHEGLQACYRDLAENVKKQFGEELTTVGAIGVSAMMHGYLAFDKDWNQLAEFRTWRNTMTGKAAEQLTALFDFNVPQRWSIAHLYQAVLNGEEHLPRLAHITTLAGYIHFLLTGENVLGVGDASGMFPIDSDTVDYDAAMAAKFDEVMAPHGYPWKFADVMPKVLRAGEVGGTLTEAGAKFLDPTGKLGAGIPMAPPEGDAGTGMAATNSVRVRTGNVSAGTSDFAMVVVDRKLGVHREIDMVTTPSGAPVAMVHCNNCTSDLNAWAALLSEFASIIGAPIDPKKVLDVIFAKALEGDKDCSGLISYNYYSGEGVTDFDEGRPVFMRMPDSRFSFANFARTNLLSALATLKIGLDILIGEEHVAIDKLYGHGGFFKAPVAGQLVLSAATGVPAHVMKTAGEGGPYGMALLASYVIWKAEGETLEDYLDGKVFADASSTVIVAEEDDIAGFERFLAAYKKALPVEAAAIAATQGA